MKAEELLGLLGYLEEGLEALEREVGDFFSWIELRGDRVQIRASVKHGEEQRSLLRLIPWVKLTESTFPGQTVRHELQLIRREVLHFKREVSQ